MTTETVGLGGHPGAVLARLQRAVDRVVIAAAIPGAKPKLRVACRHCFGLRVGERGCSFIVRSAGAEVVEDPSVHEDEAVVEVA